MWVQPALGVCLYPVEECEVLPPLAEQGTALCFCLHWPPWCRCWGDLRPCALISLYSWNWGSGFCTLLSVFLLSPLPCDCSLEQQNIRCAPWPLFSPPPPETLRAHDTKIAPGQLALIDADCCCFLGSSEIPGFGSCHQVVCFPVALCV